MCINDTNDYFVDEKKSMIERYFQALNTENFQAAANLFASDGVLYPPFHEGVVGREAIAHYLEEEAKGIKLFPINHSTQPSEIGTTEHVITGKVQTSLFYVNASWHILLNAGSEIQSVKVKLLASLVELMNLQ
jgi:ketosteroid isomerase-like protein